MLIIVSISAIPHFQLIIGWYSRMNAPKKKNKAPVIATVFVLLAAIGGFLAWTFLSNRETCEHIAVNIAGKEATCTENGLTEGQQCELCGKILVQQNVIPASHTPGAEATCVAAQNCTICNAELKAPLGHTAGAEATCTTAQKCTVCQTELKAALGHTPADEWEILKEPSTTENGNKVKKCTLCGEKVAEELIPAIGNLDLLFAPFGNGACYVSDIGNCTATEIVIPSTYNGMTVTAIGDSAFENCAWSFKIIGTPKSYIQSYAHENLVLFESINGDEPEEIKNGLVALKNENDEREG